MNSPSAHPKPGSFTDAVRDGQIKGPQQRGFSRASWEAGFKALGSGDADRILYNSGLWFDAHFTAVRAEIEKTAKLADLSGPISLKAVIAAANREWVLSHKMIGSMMEGKDTFCPEEIDQTLLKTNSGNPIYFSNMIDTLVDGVRYPLAQAAFAPVANRDGMGDQQWSAHTHFTSLGGYYGVLEGYWMQCVWNHYGIEERPDEFRLRSFDEGFHKAHAVSTHRRDARNTEQGIIAVSVYKRLAALGQLGDHIVHRPILSLFKKGGIFRVKASLASRFPGKPQGSPSYREFCLEEHLDALTKRKFTCLRGLSIDQLLQVFELFNGLPSQAALYIPKETAPNTWTKAEPFAPIFRTAELASEIRSALGFSETQIQFVMDFVTWKPGPRNGIWFSPLVKLNEEHVSFVCFSIEGVNFVRLCDDIIGRFPEIRSEADPAFEKFLRARLGHSLSESSLAQLTAIHPNPFMPTDPKIGDIDLLFRLGNTIWVGEAKSFSNAYEPLEDYRHREMLKTEAVPQAKRKAKYVEQHLAEIAPFLGAARQQALIVRPLVVTSNPLFAGFPIDGVPVVDWHILDLYFSQGDMKQFGYTTSDGRTAHVDRVKFYNSAGEAESRFVDYLLNPPQVANAIKHLKEDVSVLAPLSPGDCRPARVFNYTVSLPTDGMESLIEKVARARGDWKSPANPKGAF
jgi:hypothetical protein